MNKIINSKIFKTTLSRIPILALALITISTNYYYFFNQEYLKIYELISYCTGFSLLSLPAYIYIVYKFKFCTYSKVAIWGIFSYIVINIIWFMCRWLFDFDGNLFSHIFEASVVTLSLFLVIYYFIKENLELMFEKLISASKISLYGVFAWLGIDIEAFGILMILMCIDSFVGSMKAIRLGREFTFKKLLWGFCLKLCFLIIPLVVALLGKSVGSDYAAAVNIVIIILSVSEAYSVFGNIYSAKNKVEVKKIDIVSILLKSLRTALKSHLDRLNKKIQDGGNCEIK